ncbi:MAG: MopE-related protein, partial [Halieaceae bacterium]
MKTKVFLIAALLASFSSIAFSATIQELEERISHIEAVLAQIDADEDSYTPEQGDCDDSDAETHPDANESDAGNDGRDNDCDGIVDEDDYYESSNETSDSDDDSDHDGSDSDDGHDD